MPKQFNGRKKSLFKKNGAVLTGCSYGNKQTKPQLLSHTMYKDSFEMNYRPKCKAIKLLKKNIWE